VDLACSDGRVRLRLWGIDAPERGQSPWGEKATDHLQSLLRGSEFQIRVLDTDIYNRAVGVILDAGADVGLRMVSDGWAAVRTRYVKDARYRNARSDARRRGIGIWSAPGLQQKPWEWRRLNPRTVG
jgi:endonuclease YncB( thermonuclease family)